MQDNEEGMQRKHLTIRTDLADLIQKAADACGVNLSAFIVRAAVADARRVLRDVT